MQRQRPGEKTGKANDENHRGGSKPLVQEPACFGGDLRPAPAPFDDALAGNEAVGRRPRHRGRVAGRVFFGCVMSVEHMTVTRSGRCKRAVKCFQLAAGRRTWYIERGIVLPLCFWRSRKQVDDLAAKAGENVLAG